MLSLNAITLTLTNSHSRSHPCHPPLPTSLSTLTVAHYHPHDHLHYQSLSTTLSRSLRLSTALAIAYWLQVYAESLHEECKAQLVQRDALHAADITEYRNALLQVQARNGYAGKVTVSDFGVCTRQPLQAETAALKPVTALTSEIVPFTSPSLNPL